MKVFRESFFFDEGQFLDAVTSDLLEVAQKRLNEVEALIEDDPLKGLIRIHGEASELFKNRETMTERAFNKKIKELAKQEKEYEERNKKADLVEMLDIKFALKNYIDQINQINSWSVFRSRGKADDYKTKVETLRKMNKVIKRGVNAIV